MGLHYAWFRDTITYLTNGRPDEPSNRTALHAAHDKHQATVKETYDELGKELLVYNVKSGWAPLCAFLGIEKCPQTPFPRANDRDMMMAITWVFWVVVWAWPLIPLIPLMLVVGLYRLCRRCCGRRATTDNKVAESKKRA